MNPAAFPGQVLRKRREAMGVTPAELYERIHVPARHINDLEAGNLDRLPVPAYTLGFLNTYCQFLELDPEPYLDAYRACLQESGPVAPSSVRTTRTAPRAERPEWWGEAVTWGALCGILLLGWITYAAIVRPFVDDDAGRLQADTIELAPPTHFEEDF